MKLKHFYRQSKANQNYLIEMFAFLPFIIMVFSGLIMIRFHTSEDKILFVWGISKSQWLFFHKICSGVASSMVVWHLAQHFYWIQQFFTLKLKNKFKFLNGALFIVFLLTAITSTLSWLVFGESFIGNALRGLHSKLGFVSIILFFFHIKNYLHWIKKMTTKLINLK